MQTTKQRGIVPRKVKGFRDIDAGQNQLRWQIINAAGKIYKKYGFEHWDTPVLEYADCLGKYMPDEDTVEQGVYSFNNPELEPVLCDDGSELRDDNNDVIMENQFLSLRYDLTAPLARHYAEKLWVNYLNGQVFEGKTPLLRRYQFGPVFRYEIKLAPGRFREFWQLDFDTVGSDDIASDTEVAMILCEALEAIGLPLNTFKVKVNNRKMLTGIFQDMGVKDERQEGAILRIVDKYDKIGLKGVEAELGGGREDRSGAKVKGLGLETNRVNAIIAYLEQFINRSGTRKEILSLLSINNEQAEAGYKELEAMDNLLSKLGFNDEQVVFDPSLIRGMAYYTGPIFEVESLLTFKDRKRKTRKVGSICGGGRYDGLVKNLLGIAVPATGGSIGVDRLAALLTLTGQALEQADGPVFIAYFDDELMEQYQLIARELRAEGINTEIFYGFHKGFRGLKKQMSYADKKNCPIAILIGENEVSKGVASIRNLKLGKELADKISDKREFRERTQSEVPLEDLVCTVKEMLG